MIGGLVRELNPYVDAISVRCYSCLMFDSLIYYLLQSGSAHEFLSSLESCLGVLSWGENGILLTSLYFTKWLMSGFWHEHKVCFWNFFWLMWESAVDYADEDLELNWLCYCAAHLSAVDCSMNMKEERAHEELNICLSQNILILRHSDLKGRSLDDYLLISWLILTIVIYTHT